MYWTSYGALWVCWTSLRLVQPAWLAWFVVLDYLKACCWSSWLDYVLVIVELTRTWSWKLRIVAIFLLFLTLWHVLTHKQADATLASLSILKYEALKWPHRVIRGSKIKSASILFKSMSDRRPWLKNSKNVIILQMRHVVLTLGVVKGQRLVFRLYRGQKIKLLRFSWKWWQIVHLLERIQKKNTLYYLTCQVTEIWCKKSLLPLAEWWPVTFWSKSIWRKYWR